MQSWSTLHDLWIDIFSLIAGQVRVAQLTQMLTILGDSCLLLEVKRSLVLRILEHVRDLRVRKIQITFKVVYSLTRRVGRYSKDRRRCLPVFVLH